MSLDVSLTLPGASISGTGIFIRENGSIREITRIEWDERFPGLEPVTLEPDETDSVYEANITHNLGQMAAAADIYMALWRPEQIDIVYAYQLIDILKDGLARLLANPEHFKQYNPTNGWGDYDGLVRFTEKYLAACIKYPHARVRAWR